ncbi:Crp/Fnr family transcriptional regulator [Aestuariivivens sediminicola]|uniref:Crp/Fnr family transcriptional regulator n=1 Tax=Aestuariivivens sediminicola TaxID=2913560 RepID=UPI001F56C893|nr:Crp/Fnr family transcriptional regulator [Aestuariivivens sediminicola]
MKNRNFQYLNSIADISEDVFDLLKHISELKFMTEGTQLVKFNEVPTKVYMLVSGLVRCYLTTEEGREYNKSFYLPLSFVASLTALMNKKPSKFVFECLSDCELFEIDYCRLMELCKQSSQVNRLYTKVLEMLYTKYERRLVELISLNATDRYLALRAQIPELDIIIPQYHIASYLGITAVQLSRIRKKMDGH